MVDHIVTWLNVFPMSGGIENISPRGLIIGTNLSYSEHCRCPFGAYVQTHEEGSNNTDAERSFDAIWLGPTGNPQGTYKLMNDTSETDGFDDDIITPDITDDAREELIDEGVSGKTNHIDNQRDDNADHDANATRNKILTDAAAQRNRTSLEVTRAQILEQGVPSYDREQNDGFTETIETSSPPLER